MPTRFVSTRRPGPECVADRRVHPAFTDRQGSQISADGGLSDGETGENAVTLRFERKAASPIVSQEIALLGLSDAVFATVVVDRAKGAVVVDVTSTTPHSYFPGETYARVTLRDRQGAVRFTKEIQALRLR
ncbi:hypothetical protein M8494_18640 [Serratia ureilytica]